MRRRIRFILTCTGDCQSHIGSGGRGNHGAACLSLSRLPREVLPAEPEGCFSACFDGCLAGGSEASFLGGGGLLSASLGGSGAGLGLDSAFGSGSGSDSGFFAGASGSPLSFGEGDLSLALRRAAAELYPGKLLSHRDGVLLLGQEFLDGASLRGVHGDIDLCSTRHISRGGLASEAASRRALSVSMVAISSSCSTKSPICLDHCLSVPSEMDAAIWGTFTIASAYVRTYWARRGNGSRRSGCRAPRSCTRRAVESSRLESMLKDRPDESGARHGTGRGSEARTRREKRRKEEK